MTKDEVAKRKDIMESAIRAAVESFSVETGMTVDGVCVEKARAVDAMNCVVAEGYCVYTQVTL